VPVEPLYPPIIVRHRSPLLRLPFGVVGGRVWLGVAQISHPLSDPEPSATISAASFFLHKAMVAPKRHRARGGGKVKQTWRGAGHAIFLQSNKNGPTACLRPAQAPTSGRSPSGRGDGASSLGVTRNGDRDRREPDVDCVSSEPGVRYRTG
jgi:hypothetical protein